MKLLRFTAIALAALAGVVNIHAAVAITENTKAYTFKTQRGVLGTQDGYLTCTVNSSYKNQGKFAVISYEGNTYLYSVADKKFTCRETTAYDTRNGGWHNVLISNNPIEPITVAQGNKFADYPYSITSEGRTFNTYVNTQKGICLSGWATYDAGNQFAVESAEDFDPTEALATLDAYFNSGIEVTYRVSDVDGNLLEEQKLSGVDGEVIRSVPTSFVRHAFTLYSVKSAVTVAKDQENVVEVEAVFQMPFSTSPDISAAHWYNLSLRSGTEFVNATEGYKCNPNPSADQLKSDEYQWAFQGDPYDGIVVFNRSDVSKTLRKSGDVAILGDGIYKWNLVEHANGFLLANQEDGKYINEYQGSGGHLIFWNNANDINSIFTVNEVGVLTSIKLESSAKARLQLYPTTSENANGGAIVVIPGGGYSYIAGSTEGADWAPMLNELGYTVGVLTYTTPPTAPDAPLADGKAAMKYLRDNAETLGLNPARIGVMGFSAGGHLASTLATHTTGDERPVFQILFYPVITMDASYTHQGSRDNLLGANPSQELVDLYSNEKQVTKETPQAYICWGTGDRTVPQANSLNYISALEHADVPVHTLPLNVANHGYGFKTDFAYHTQIVNDLTTWLKSLQFDEDAIHSTTGDRSEDSNIYDLGGRRMSASTSRPLSHGVYVRGGQKLMVK
ncbi:MAG: alpha/beta hydrolase [Bacteroidaceae bacterium]|nr:alpha/beta hydrolase [Bacteroidaceae bacterium]